MSFPDVPNLYFLGVPTAMFPMHFPGTGIPLPNLLVPPPAYPAALADSSKTASSSHKSSNVSDSMFPAPNVYGTSETVAERTRTKTRDPRKVKVTSVSETPSKRGRYCQSNDAVKAEPVSPEM